MTSLGSPDVILIFGGTTEGRTLSRKLAARGAAVTVSVGAAHGDERTNSAELFNRADHALYDTKHNGRCGITYFEQAPLSFAKA